MSRRPRPRKFWDDRETTPADLERGKTNRQQVLTGLIQHARSTGPLDAARVAEWHAQCLSGLSYVSDPTWLGAYRGGDHPDLEALGVRVGTIEGVSPHDVTRS